MLDVAEVGRETNVIASHLAAGGGQIWDTGGERRNVHSYLVTNLWHGLIIITLAV